MSANGESAIPPFSAEVKLKGFKVYEVDVNAPNGHSYNRKDFYKISLNTGKYIFHYADKSYETGETILFFGNPRIPYSCDVISQTDGYACLFTEEFFRLSERSESILHSPLFKIDGTPIFQITQTRKAEIADIFKKMIAEQDSDYAYKDELIHSYIGLIIHEALKLQPSDNSPSQKNAAVRIASVFLELLERQFPIENMNEPLALRTAQDYAEALSVHVNYLNSAVKKITGQPTSIHIADRIIAEAKSLLQHTDWSISEIAYSLGFEYPTYFNNFFKKKTGYVPKTVRAAHL
ncbi:helix-turn-helix domain-containing protein [Chitinophaga sp. RAB17]|uniref:helix-turn-helix domain-containing protein n=1 Tax=Chitinophaga sp. RAB17 TaxID=3233049 RepID=UPI003F9360A6